VSQVVILAGGSGSRLKAVTGDNPKALVDVCGTPLLGRQLIMIAASGLRDVAILTGVGADAIAAYCGDGSAWGLTINCLAEPEGRGTAGAVLAALDHLAERFLVLYGDTVMDIDLDRLMAAHERHAPAATLVVLSTPISSMSMPRALCAASIPARTPMASTCRISSMRHSM
jgi:NDP-sugar pyrophosphorylase family protein